MAIFNGVIPGADVDFSANDLEFASFVSANATTYVYLTNGGHLVTVTGVFGFPGAPDEPIGNVSNVDIDLGNDGSTDYQVTGIAGLDVSLLYLAPANVGLMDILLAGGDLFTTVAGVDNIVAADANSYLFGAAAQNDLITVTGTGNYQHVSGDFLNLTTPGSYSSGDDSFIISGNFSNDALGRSSTIIGDSDMQGGTGVTVFAGDDNFSLGVLSGDLLIVSGDVADADGVLHGGNDSFNGTGIGAYVVGDAAYIGTTNGNLTGTVFGGNDTIASGSFQTGDVISLFSGTVVGGNDVMTALPGTSTNMYGDVSYVNANAGTMVSVTGGNDVMTGGDDVDFMVGDIRQIYVTVTNGTFVFGDDEMSGGAGNDVMYGDWFIDNSGLLTSDQGGNDIMDGGAGNDSIFGQGGDDWLAGGTGINTVDGGEGNDTAVYWLAVSAVTVNLTLQGVAQSTLGAGFDTLVSIENLIGSAFSDTLTGDANDNILSGYFGNDTINGGAGNDTAAYLFDLAGVNVDLSIQGAAQNTGGSGIDELNSIENLLGSGFDDNLLGNTGDNIIDGAGGDDFMHGGSGNDTASYGSATGGVHVTLEVQNGAAQDTGNAGLDTLLGFENLRGSRFNDALTGNNGDNRLEGGDGDDDFEGLGGADEIDGGNGIDTVSYENSAGAVTVYLDGTMSSGGDAQGDVVTNVELLIGSDFADTLNGNDADNRIEGGLGYDTIYGGDGNDTLNGGLGIDTVDGGDGIDTLNLSASTNTQTLNLVTNVNIGGFAHNDMFFNIENVIGSSTRGDDITGTAGDNILFGLGADDVLRGFNGNDQLFGGADNDFLFGGRGADALDGGSGNDWAMYNDADHGVIVDLNGVGSGGIYSDGDTYNSIERVRGSDFADTITMDDNVNRVLGDDGDDTIFGMGGNRLAARRK